MRIFSSVTTRRANYTTSDLRRYLKFLWPVFWINAFFDRYTGGPQRPVFFDISETAPSLTLLTEQQAQIKEELERVLAVRSSIPRYHDLDFLQFSISGKIDKDRDWKVLMLYAMGERPLANRSLCPKTCELLDRIPGLVQAFFSILDAGKSIPPHAAPYRGYLRYHLALRTPAKNPPTLHIEGQQYAWQEGEAILFDDTYYHEVVNKADEVRVILVVDVLRPLPPLADLVNRLLLLGAARYIYAKGVLQASALITRFSKTARARAPFNR
jgi:aspartyl/asparaginyl beta-hydroxylase (cupin superfamily)